MELNSHDGHTPEPRFYGYHQNHARKGTKAISEWWLDVEQDGEYEIAVRRYPKHVNVAINSAVPAGDKLPQGSEEFKAGKAMDVKSVCLKIGDFPR